MPNMEVEKGMQFERKSAYQKRWESFKNQIHDYHSTRNFDLGPSKHQTTVSCLSPWIAHRTVSERCLLKELNQLDENPGVEKWRDELIWRLYFRSYMWHHQSIWHQLRSTEIVVQIAPETNISAFNGWVQELETTGYLHNHARMWLASIWIFSLGLDWRAGALWMYTRLLDGDIASNTLGWRWVAGLHTKGKAYHAASGNILQFTRGRFSEYTLPARKAHCLTEAPLETYNPGHLKAIKIKRDIRLGLLFHPLDLSGSLPKDHKPNLLVSLHQERVPLKDYGSASLNLVHVAHDLFPETPCLVDERPEIPLPKLLQTLALERNIEAWIVPFPGTGPYLDLFKAYNKIAAKDDLVPLYFITDPLDPFIFEIKETSYFGFQRKFKKRLSAELLEADILFTELVQPISLAE